MKRTILFFAAVFALVSLFGRPGSSLAHTGNDYCLGTEEAAFLVLINQYRAANNLGLLVASHDLGAAAEHHAEDMADQDYFSHTGQNGSKAKERMADHGYTFDTWWAENISAGTGRETAQDAFNGWKASPGHNTNMLNPNLVAIGIDRAESAASEHTFYWTTVFGGVVDEEAKDCKDAAPAPAPNPAPAPAPNPAPAPAPQPVPGGGDRADRDIDGLYDEDEVDVYRTDPDSYDSDADGYSDGEEVYFGTDPLDANDYPDDMNRLDSDGDGLFDDDEEFVYRTDPHQFDSDGDGYGDGEEIYYNSDPTNDLSTPEVML